MSNKGFTLIEVVIYIGLFSLIIGGAMASAYSVIQWSGNDSGKFQTQEEANFLLRKIDWLLTGANSVAPLGVGQTLNVQNQGTNYVFSIAQAAMMLKIGSASPIILNSSNVSVASLSFQVTPETGVVPASVRATFTVNGQQFETKKYLWK